MNKERRILIKNIVNKLEDIVGEIEEIKETEQEAKDGIDGYPQFEEKAMNMEMTIDSMEESMEMIRSGIENLNDALQ